jgi:hypothetical protein
MGLGLTYTAMNLQKGQEILTMEHQRCLDGSGTMYHQPSLFIAFVANSYTHKE